MSKNCNLFFWTSVEKSGSRETFCPGNSMSRLSLAACRIESRSRKWRSLNRIGRREVPGGKGRIGTFNGEEWR